MRQIRRKGSGCSVSRGRREKNIAEPPERQSQLSGKEYAVVSKQQRQKET
jgi:hypothetical protein